MKCPKCGKSIPDRAFQCPYCGKRVQAWYNTNLQIETGELANVGVLGGVEA